MSRKASIILTEDEFQTIAINVRMALEDLHNVEDRSIHRYYVSCAEMRLERALRYLDGTYEVTD